MLERMEHREVDSSFAFLALSGLFPPSSAVHSLSCLVFQMKLENLARHWTPENLQVTNVCCYREITECDYDFGPLTNHAEI